MLLNSILEANPTWTHETIVIYDGDCPFCARYVELQRLRTTLGRIVLVDARERTDLVRLFNKHGLDLNEGMVLIMNGMVFYGSDCLNRLALMSTRSGIFNRVNAFLFSSKKVSKIVYPFFKAGRRFTLWVLRRKPLSDDVVR